MLTQRQLDDAELESNGSPTHLIRNLIGVFYTSEQLASMSCYGSGKMKQAIDQNVLAACISEYM